MFDLTLYRTSQVIQGLVFLRPLLLRIYRYFIAKIFNYSSLVFVLDILAPRLSVVYFFCGSAQQKG